MQAICSTVEMFGTGQHCSLKWGVRLSRVFVRWGSTVYWCCVYIAGILNCNYVSISFLFPLMKITNRKHAANLLDALFILNFTAFLGSVIVVR